MNLIHAHAVACLLNYLQYIAHVYKINNTPVTFLLAGLQATHQILLNMLLTCTLQHNRTPLMESNLVAIP